MRVMRGTWHLALGGPALLALLVAACAQDQQVPETRLALYPECPGHPFKIKYYQITVTEDTVATDSLAALPNAGAISGIPEYHDCQKLGMGIPARYWTLAGIFAYEALGTLYTGGGAPSTLRAAAEIVAFEGSYRPLSIELGFNCLYLWQESGAWSARIFSAGGDPSLCAQEMGKWTAAAGHDLQVQAEAVPDMRDEDYPPVARWEWDPSAGEQFIGIRCGANWCSVRRPDGGPGRFPERGPAALPPPATGLTGLPPARWDRARLVRGWYDEQRLALPTASPGQLMISEIVGTILPHPELGARKDAADYAGNWKEVARVIIDPATGVEHYQTKLGLQPGLNVIEMQQVSALPDDPALAECKQDDDGLFWLARVSLEGRQPSLRCVERIIHPESPTRGAAPGTARWRWDPNDEKTWVTCPKGCCTIN